MIGARLNKRVNERLLRVAIVMIGALWKPSKKTSCERIDGKVALVMGLDLASREVDTKSIYSTPGNLAL